MLVAPRISEYFGLPWSAIVCLGLLGLFQITKERLKCSKAISGMDGWMDGKALILRAPLCVANNKVRHIHVHR